MNLTPTQLAVLVSIHKGAGYACLRPYRFSSAAVLDRCGLIEGDRLTPYWQWKLTARGKEVLRLAAGKQER